jgi:hypothetical protein
MYAEGSKMQLHRTIEKHVDKWIVCYHSLYPGSPKPAVGAGQVWGVKRKFDGAVGDLELPQYSTDARFLTAIMLWGMSPERRPEQVQRTADLARLWLRVLVSSKLVSSFTLVLRDGPVFRLGVNAAGMCNFKAVLHQLQFFAAAVHQA